MPIAHPEGTIVLVTNSWGALTEVLGSHPDIPASAINKLTIFAIADLVAKGWKLIGATKTDDNIVCPVLEPPKISEPASSEWEYISILCERNGYLTPLVVTEVDPDLVYLKKDTEYNIELLSFLESQGLSFVSEFVDLYRLDENLMKPIAITVKFRRKKQK